MSKFLSYTVGYIGDYAGVRMELDKPIITRSEKPKGNFDRQSFEVVTTSQCFNRESLATAVKDALVDPSSPNRDILLNAHEALVQFIQKNGAINPNEAADWENYVPHGSGCSKLEMV